MKYSEHLVRRNYWVSRQHDEFIKQQCKLRNSSMLPELPRITEADILREILDKAMRGKK